MGWPMPKRVCSEKACLPAEAIRRLVRYYRDIKHLRDEGEKVVSSFFLSDMLGVSPDQIRKDLSYLGEFGKPGVGYDLDNLVKNLEERLGLSQPAGAVLIGVGRLGMALMGYDGFRNINISIVAGFDIDEAKVGSVISGVEIYHIRNISKACRRLKPDVAIIAVPARAAQKVCDIVVRSGIKGILNFAPVRLSAPNCIWVSNVDLSVELGCLLFCSKVGKSGEKDASS